MDKKRINDVLHMSHTKYEFMVKIISYRTVCCLHMCNAQGGLDSGQARTARRASNWHVIAVQILLRPRLL